MNEAMNLVVLNSLAVWLINLLKYSRFVPWITVETGKVNQYLSAALSALAAAGMVFTVTHTGTMATGAITISWVGLTVSNLVSFVYHWGAYFTSQKTIYKIWSQPAGAAAAKIVTAAKEVPGSAGAAHD